MAVPSGSESSDRRSFLVPLRIAGAILLVLVCIGWVFPSARWWGVHHLAFLSPPVSILLLLSGGFFLTPWSVPLMRRVVDLARKIPPAQPLWVWAAVAFALFLLLRVQEPFMGDGQLLLTHLVTLGRLEARLIPSVDKGSVHWTEPFEYELHENAFRLVAKFRPPPDRPDDIDVDDNLISAEKTWFFEAGRWSYIVLAAIAGALLVLLAVRFARKMLPENSRAVFVATLLCGGGVLLFFGYVEDYAWTALAICAVALFAIEESADGSRWPLKTLLAYAVAVGCHLLTLVFLPAVALLVLLKQSGEEGLLWRAVRWRWFVAAMAVAAVLTYVVVFYGPGLHYMLSPYPTDSPDGYSLLAGRHWWDMLNVLLLCVALPGGAALLKSQKAQMPKSQKEDWRLETRDVRRDCDSELGASLSGTLSSLDFASRPLSPGPPPSSRSKDFPHPPCIPPTKVGGKEGKGEQKAAFFASRVLQVMGVCGGAFVFIISPDLGAARDWDLLCLGLWPLVVLGAWKLAQMAEGRRVDVLAVIVGFALLVPVPYVLENAFARSEVARSEMILGLEPARAAYGWESVAAYYRREGDAPNAIRAVKAAMALDENPRYKLNLAEELRLAGRLEEAEPLYIAAASARPDLAKYLLFLCKAYAKRGQSDRILPLVKIMVELQPENPVFTKLLESLGGNDERGMMNDERKAE
ncbi:MAG TPA: hypothetical protein VGL38_03595 [bacterium]